MLACSPGAAVVVEPAELLQTQTIDSAAIKMRKTSTINTTTTAAVYLLHPLTLLLLVMEGAPDADPNWNGDAPGPSFTSNEFPVIVGAELPNAGTLFCGAAVTPPNIPVASGAAFEPNGLLLLLRLALPNNDGVLSAGFAGAAVAAPPNGLDVIPLPNVLTGAGAPNEGVPLLMPPNRGAAGFAASVPTIPKGLLVVAAAAGAATTADGCPKANVDDVEEPKTLGASDFAPNAAEPKANVVLGASLGGDLISFVAVVAGLPKATVLIATDEGLPNSGCGLLALSEVVVAAALPNANGDEVVADGAALPKLIPFAAVLAASFAAPNKGVLAAAPNTGEATDSIFLGASSLTAAAPNNGALGVAGLLPKANVVDAGAASAFFFSSATTADTSSVFFTSVDALPNRDVGAPKVNPPTAGLTVVAAAAAEEETPNLNPPIGVISFAGEGLLSAATGGAAVAVVV